MAYLPRQSVRKLRIELRRNKGSHQEHYAAKRIDIALDSWSDWITVNPNDLRRMPPRIKIVVRSRCGQLQLYIPYDCRETEICETWIPRTIDQHISLRSRMSAASKVMIVHTGWRSP
jgi:hypothetical protein